jgi:hypothetical protein
MRSRTIARRKGLKTVEEEKKEAAILEVIWDY